MLVHVARAQGKKRGGGEQRLRRVRMYEGAQVLEEGRDLLMPLRKHLTGTKEGRCAQVKVAPLLLSASIPGCNPLHETDRALTAL